MILNVAAKTIPERLARLDDQQELGNQIVAEVLPVFYFMRGNIFYKTERLRRNPLEVRVTSGQKPSTKIIYIVLQTSVRLF